MGQARTGYIGRIPGETSVTKATQVNTLTGSTETITFNSGYDIGYLDVFLNGVKQTINVDYTAGNGTSFTFLGTPLPGIGTVVESVAYKAFNLGEVDTVNNVTISVSGTDLTFSVPGVGSTTLTLS